MMRIKKSATDLILPMITLIAMSGFGQISKEKINYKKLRDSVSLKLLIYEHTETEYENVEDRPCVLFLSGGGWKNFAWYQKDPLAKAFTDLGMSCITVEYRTSKNIWEQVHTMLWRM